MKNIPSYHDFIGSIQSESEPITESSMGDYGQVNQLMVKLSKLLSSVHGTHQIAGQAMVYVIQSNSFRCSDYTYSNEVIYSFSL
jgi:hypothetical protein